MTRADYIPRQRRLIWNEFGSLLMKNIFNLDTFDVRYFLILGFTFDRLEKKKYRTVSPTKRVRHICKKNMYNL